MILILAASLAAAAPARVSCPPGQATSALVCRALSAKAAGDIQGAALAFEQAANGAAPNDLQVPRLWVAAGNMWLAADQAGKAALDLDRALGSPGLEAEQRGEALLDRARAAEAQGDLKVARAKWSEAGQTIANDPFYWYFSAALAIREGDRGNAEASIKKALAMAPDDPTVLFEAGHVADFLGDREKARSYWSRAAAADHGEVGKAAQKAVELLGVTPVVKLEAIPPK